LELGTKMGVMPPWFIDKHVGIEQYKDDLSLSEREIAAIADWADKGAPRGNDADMPPARVFAGKVSFDPPQTKVWEDHRDGGDSPWSAGWSTPPVPPGNKWTVRATFSDPGTYVLRALAHDGGLIDCDDLTVTVTR